MQPDRAGEIAGLRIEPIDPLLFGDNRAARAGVDHLQADQDPSPLTIHGAVGRWLAGNDDSRWPDSLLGPRQRDVLAPEAEIAELCGWCAEDRRGVLLFPRPLSLRCRRIRHGSIEALDLLSPTGDKGCRSSSKLGSLVLAASEEEKGHGGTVWLSEGALGDVLTCEVPSAGVLDQTEVFRAEARPGIAVDNRTGTVHEGYFFTRPYRRFQPGALDPARESGPGLRAWFRTLEPISSTPGGREIGFLGGDRRRARFSVVDRLPHRSDVLPDLRRRVETAAAASRGLYLYLLTPAIAGEALPPEGLKTVQAALTGKPRFASGWDVRKQRPRELLALIPEGSVFYFDWPEKSDRTELIRRLWLAPVSRTGAAAGFGRALVGVW